MEEVREGGRKRTVREEFETLTTVARKSGTGGERRERERLRETESAPAYNLKTHSAFKLLTMAAGYKVLCRCRCEREVRTRAGSRRRDKRDSKV